MNEDASRRTSKGGPPAREGLRPSLVAGVSMLAVALILGAVLVQRRANREEQQEVAKTNSLPAPKAESVKPGERVTRVQSVEGASENSFNPAVPKTVARRTNTVVSA